MSVLEAMARGIPTVATAVGGVPQVIENGVNGFLVNVDDIETLSKMLIALLESTALRETVGVASRETILRSFSIARSISEVIEVYRSCLSQ